MKKVLPIVLVAVIVILGFVFVPKLTHTCSDCGEFFVGTGYEPNVLEDMMADEEMIICEDCAMQQHALALAMGKSLDEFKLDF